MSRGHPVGLAEPCRLRAGDASPAARGAAGTVGPTPRVGFHHPRTGGSAGRYLERAEQCVVDRPASPGNVGGAAQELVAGSDPALSAGPVQADTAAVVPAPVRPLAAPTGAAPRP